mgnify:CR=1 FL=1
MLLVVTTTFYCSVPCKASSGDSPATSLPLTVTYHVKKSISGQLPLSMVLDLNCDKVIKGEVHASGCRRVSKSSNLGSERKSVTLYKSGRENGSYTFSRSTQFKYYPTQTGKLLVRAYVRSVKLNIRKTPESANVKIDVKVKVSIKLRDRVIRSYTFKGTGKKDFPGISVRAGELVLITFKIIETIKTEGVNWFSVETTVLVETFASVSYSGKSPVHLKLNVNGAGYDLGSSMGNVLERDVTLKTGKNEITLSSPSGGSGKLEVEALCLVKRKVNTRLVYEDREKLVYVAYFSTSSLPPTVSYTHLTLPTN